MFSAILVLCFIPWLDTSRVRSAKYRPVFKVFFWVFVATCVGLGYLGAMPPEGGYVLAARLLAVYYFAFFIIVMPLLGLFETPRPVPASIADAVLKNAHGAKA